MIAPILVTGAAGFIGTNLCLELQRRGLGHVASDRRPPSVPMPGFRQVDLLDQQGVRSLVLECVPTTIFHLGARTDLSGKNASDYTANTNGLEHLLAAACSLAAPPRFIFASSRLVFRIDASPRDPYDYSATTAYGLSKVLGERRLRATPTSVLPWVIVRPTSIWGPWFDVPYRTFFDAIRRRRYVHPAGRRIHKSFGFVGNAVDQLLAIALAPPAAVVGRPFFLADHQPIEVGDFADTIADAFQVDRPRRMPIGALRLLARSGDALAALGLMKSPPLTSFRLDNLLADMVYDTDPTLQVAGPPRFLQADGIAETVAWMRSCASG